MEQGSDERDGCTYNHIIVAGIGDYLRLGHDFSVTVCIINWIPTYHFSVLWPRKLGGMKPAMLENCSLSICDFDQSLWGKEAVLARKELP